jgi:polyadenylate-binding protein
MRYDDLASLSPVVRKEVLTGELSRRVKKLDIVPAKEIGSIVDSLVNVSLSEVLQYVEDPGRLHEQVEIIKAKRSKVSTPEKSPSRSASASQDSRLLDPNALNATASAPEHPSTPISVSESSSPPRTSSPSGSVPPISERDRIIAAVGKLESTRHSELTDLLMSLPKRERALCLFNAEYLRTKIADAKMVLDSEDGDEEDKNPPDTQSTKSAPHTVPVTPQPKKTAPRVVDSPHTPDLSSRGPSANASPLPPTPGSASSAHTLASLSKLPAAEIIRLSNSSSATGLPLPKADPLVVQATDEFIDSLLGKPPQMQKQQLGDKL